MACRKCRRGGAPKLIGETDLVTIRAARVDELERLRAIEKAAGALFRTVGMDAIAEHDPFPLDELEDYRAAGRCWVVADATDTPVAYVLADIVDGNGHVEQLSVHPDHAGQRLGAALIDHVVAWASDRGLPAVTLTTFRDVPWNAPYYLRCGFTVLDDPGPELRALVAEEATYGLDPTIRVCMIRPTT
jgi:GNAT superfamily N-acetyltransferase